MTYVHTYICMLVQQKSFTGNTRSNNLKYETGRFDPEVSVNSRVHLPSKRVLQANTLYPAVDKDLQVETSGFIFLIIATCVARKRFLLFT